MGVSVRESSMSDTSKLHVDLEKGILTAEGSEEFLKAMYAEFDKRVERLAVKPPSAAVQSLLRDIEEDSAGAESVDDAVRKTRARRTRARTSTAAAGSTERVGNYAPEMEKDLNLAGLAEFCDPWAPKNHSERVLLYASFLEEKLQIRPCTANQIYTCYRTLREKIPEILLQALRDASGNRYGYIDYKSPKEVSVTTIGLNHFQQGGMKKKAVNER